jgi:archaeosine-15-forming tRNA-guanine transglycosylase
MKTKKQIKNHIINIIKNNGASIETDNKIYDYAYSLQQNQQELIKDLHETAVSIASKFITHPRVNTQASQFADNKNVRYIVQVWDGAQHIMSELHSDPIRVLISFEHACEIRWGKKTFFSEINLDEEKMKKVHDELMEFINAMDELIPKKFRTNKDTDFRTGLEL